MGKSKLTAKYTSNKSKLKKTKKDKMKKVEEILKGTKTKQNIENIKMDLQKLSIKQQEASKVIQEKGKLLITNKLPYIEYVELQEEICRLKEFREDITNKINKLQKVKKKTKKDG